MNTPSSRRLPIATAAALPLRRRRDSLSAVVAAPPISCRGSSLSAVAASLSQPSRLLPPSAVAPAPPLRRRAGSLSSRRAGSLSAVAAAPAFDNCHCMSTQHKPHVGSDLLATNILVTHIVTQFTFKDLFLYYNLMTKTIDMLIEAFMADIFPTTPAIADCFGWENVNNDEHLSIILGLYQGMIKRNRGQEKGTLLTRKIS